MELGKLWFLDGSCTPQSQSHVHNREKNKPPKFASASWQNRTMTLDQEIAHAELAIRDQEDALRATVRPFADAMAGEAASYIMTEVRGVVIDRYETTEAIGDAGVSKLRSEVEAVIAALTEQALEIYTQGDPMIYAIGPRQDVWPTWGLANGEPLWVQTGFKRLLEPINGVLKQYYGAEVSLPRDDIRNPDTFSDSTRHPAAVNDALTKYRAEREKLKTLHNDLDVLKARKKMSAAASAWDAS